MCPSRHLGQQRLRIAQLAARLIHEHGLSDYRQAKRKAARQLGIADERALPDNIEIEAALRSHLALFAGAQHPALLRALREAAVVAMQYLEQFQPRLVGPVLDGTADPTAPVCLHLYAEQPLAVEWFLTERGIPFQRGDRRLRLDPRRELMAPTVSFAADGVDFQLTVLPLDGLRQAPLDPIDQRPMRRASLARLRQLLD